MRNKALIVITVILAITIVPAFAADGPALFKTKCSSCHGVDGKAQTAVGKSLKIGDFSSAEFQKLTDAEITKIIEDGKGKMPSYKGKLTADEIGALVKTLRSFKK